MRRRAGAAGAAVLLAVAFSGCGVSHQAKHQGPLRGQTYVAMGDSYTAAPGLASSHDHTGCYRSTANYPQRVAKATGLVLLDASCSGATTSSITGSQTTIFRRTVGAQDAALNPDTDVVTLSIGANDFGLYSLISNVCPGLADKDPAGTPCTDANIEGKVHLKDLLNQVEPKLESTLQTVIDRAPNAKVFLVGYPSVVPEHGTCPQLPLAAGDYPFARSIILGLDRIMEQAAKTTGVTYVDVLSHTLGHDICAEDPWIAGNKGQKGKAAAWHPYAGEQQAVADLLEKLLLS